MIRPIDRRAALVRLAAVGLAPFFIGTRAASASAEVVKEIHALKPGEYSWHPERSPSGAMAVVVSIPEQPGMSLAAGEDAGETIVSRFRSDRDFRQAMKRSMHTGMMMIVTDTPLHPDRRWGDDFVIMASA